MPWPTSERITAKPSASIRRWTACETSPSRLPGRHWSTASDSAARVDRCSEFGVYWHIILPLMKPALVVLGIYTFLTQWTSFLWPLVATTSNDMYMLTVGVQSIKTIYTTDWGLISAGSVLTMIPITIVFILLQRYFIAASIAGALKS